MSLRLPPSIANPNNSTDQGDFSDSDQTASIELHPEEIPAATNCTTGVRTIANSTKNAYRILIPRETNIAYKKDLLSSDYSDEMKQPARDKFKVAILQTLLQSYLHPAHNLTFSSSTNQSITADDLMSAAFDYCDQLFNEQYAHNFQPNEINILQKIILSSNWRTRDGINEIFEKFKAILGPEFTLKFSDGSTKTISYIDIYKS